MDNSKLNAKEQDILEYIQRTIRNEGYAPSVRDIQAALGIRSTSTVHSYLARMEQKGYLRKEQGKSRSLRLEVGDPASKGSVKLPLLGKVAAGMPILAVENLEGYLELPQQLVGSARGSELFALRISGESMIGDGILNGDLVVVRKENAANDGDIVVALVEEEATVKRIYKEANGFRLQPSNPSMQPIYASEVYVLGKVVAVMRSYQG